MRIHKNNQLVSIIIPTHNRAFFIKQAVESVLSQEYAPFELIVVDDGSSDGSVNILKTYGKRISLIRQKCQGVSAARNRGIASSKGELIAFLDSDDLWLPQKLARQALFFKSNPEVEICQTEEVWHRKGIRVNPRKCHQKPCGDIFERSLKLCLVSPSAVMMRKRLLDKVGVFDESLPACEDYDLWLRVSCRFPVHLIDEALIIKRGGHADQLSAAPGLDKYRIHSMVKLICSGTLTAGQKRATLKVLRQKCAIYAGGCLKRHRDKEGSYYKGLAARMETGGTVCGEELQHSLDLLDTFL